MNYIESVTTTVTDTLSAIPTSPEVTVHALSLRNSSILRVAAAEATQKLEFSVLSPEDQDLFRTRIFGGMATKLALASSHSEAPTFYELSPDDQQQELSVLIEKYTQSAIESDMLANMPNGLIRSWVYDTRRARIDTATRRKSLLSYINVRPGTFPPEPYFIDPMGENDVNLVQAFGRDSITDKKLVSVRDMRQKLGDDDAMLDYLKTIEFKPGPSNIALADEVARLLVSDTPTEQILQWEVSFALEEGHPDIYKKYRNYIHIVWPHGEAYRTYEVKKDSIDIRDRIGLYNPTELAHGDMMARAIAILGKLGVQADPIAADIPFDPGSKQWPVKGPKRFMAYEAMARTEHILNRRISF